MINLKVTSRNDACILAAGFEAERAEYTKHFTAFSNYNNLLSIIEKKRKDLVWTIRFQNQISGIYFLRGFDEGYCIPSFGIYVMEKFSGSGIARFALNDAIQKVQSMQIKHLMLKVSKKNIRAYKLYTEIGFVFNRRCPDTGQDILYLDI